MSCRILVVEDESIIAADLESMLSDLGHNVVGSIDNGLGALALAKTLLPDIIFMDVKINGNLDGIETALLIDGILEKTIPFIFTSAYHPEEPKLPGKHVWIQKPYTVCEIEKAIKQIH